MVALPIHKLELPAEVASCSSARRFVQKALNQATEELRADALLLVSELVANAVLHATGPLCLELLRKGSTYRIAVSDGSPTPPTAKGYRTDDATGRGVHLLDSLAAAWGCKRIGTGKVVCLACPSL